jgi:pimeloyl-ACP methyl ester carboxylesterase
MCLFPSVLLLAAAVLPGQDVQAPIAQRRAAADRTVADLYTPGAETGWVFEQNGKRIGHHWFRYEGPADLPGGRLHHFVAGIWMDAVPLVAPEQRYLTDLWVDEQGHPVRHVLRARLGDVVSLLELTIIDTTGSVHLVQGGVPRDFEVTVPADAFLQMNNALGYFELLLALQPPPAEGARSYTLFSTNALQALPYEARHVPDAEQGGFVLEDSLGETLILDGTCRTMLGVQIAAQGLDIRRTDESLEHFELDEVVLVEEDVTVFDSEEVVILHGDVSPAGTVTFPPGVEPPYAAVFFISGSGGQDRNGRSAGLDLGTREILDRLTSDGFLVLRVDDRGVGGSTGPTDGMTYHDLVADALSCLDHLLAREDVDADRVALIGHSEGGVTAPLLALERPELAAIVLMAATGRPLTEVILEQNATALEAQGMEPEERAETLEQVRRALEWASGDDEQMPDDLPEAMRSIAGLRPWLRSHARQDPLETIRRVACPVLILQGAKDFQVSPERDARVLDAALTEAGRAEHELVVFPGLDHLFKSVPGEVSRLADYFLDRAVDEAFLEALSAWLTERLGPNA